MKRTVKDLVGLKGKTVLVRVDFNVSIDENGKIMDTTRIVRSLPTISYLVRQGAKVVLMSHLGRPKGYEVHKSLWPVALYLQKALRCGVGFCNSLADETAKYRVKTLRPGSVLLLENSRFFDGEESCDKNLSKTIADMGDIFVNDAFGSAHRKSATTYGVARLMPNAIGLLMQQEIENLTSIVENPKHPFLAIIGGAKVNTKLKILDKLLEKADTIAIGGAMAYTFLKAKGENVGDSIVQEDMIDSARAILDKAEALGKKILLPVDHICLITENKKSKMVEVKNIKGSMVGYDIGTATVRLFEKAISKAKLVFWNGPMGMFEDDRFSTGTFGIGEAVSSAKGHTIAGGGDTIAALNKFGLAKNIDFISTGGGATMEYIEQGYLPCIEVIQEKII